MAFASLKCLWDMQKQRLMHSSTSHMAPHGSWTTRTQDNSYPRRFVPKTTRTQDNSCPRRLIPKTTRTQDNSYPRRLIPRTTRTQDDSYPREFVPRTSRMVLFKITRNFTVDQIKTSFKSSHLVLTIISQNILIPSSSTKEHFEFVHTRCRCTIGQLTMTLSLWFMIVTSTDNTTIPFIWVLSVNPTDNTPHARIIQEHKQKCVGLVPNVEYKHILQPPKYFNFTVNRFNYININITKNRNITTINLLGPYRFNLQTTVGHHRHYMNCGHCFYNFCGKHFVSVILELLNVYQCYPKLIYNTYTILQRRVSLTRPWRVGAGRLPWCWDICLSIGNRSTNRHRNLWTICLLLMMPGLIKILVIYDMYSNV